MSYLCILYKKGLWDKSLDIFKDRNATRKAWYEFCPQLKDFDMLEDSKMKSFDKYVQIIYLFISKCYWMRPETINTSNTLGLFHISTEALVSSESAFGEDRYPIESSYVQKQNFKVPSIIREKCYLHSCNQKLNLNEYK